MYEVIFTNNFLLNFLFSSIFILFNIIFSYLISIRLNQSKVILFANFQPLIIFFIIFLIYVFLFNILILLNLNSNFRLISLIFIFFQIIYFIKNIGNLNFNFFKKIQINNIDKYVIIISLFFYLISILPISDADSIALHQNISNQLYFYGIKNIDLQYYINFSILSNSQILQILSPILNSDNFGAQLNVLTLLFFLISSYKIHKNFTLILFSCPLIIYFISAQKLQLFFGVLYLLVFVIIHQKLIKHKIGLCLTIFLLAFYASANLNYILLSIPLYFFLIFKYKKMIKDIIIFSALSFIIIIFPLFLIKHIYYGNFIAPFLDDIFGKNNTSYNAYAYALRSTEGWLSNPLNYEYYLRPFISFKIQTLSSSFGLIFIFMLIDYKMLKKLNYFPILLILIILSTGQILPRYYFEAFLILAYFFKFKNILPKLIILGQSSVIFIISITFIYISYVKLNVIHDKTSFLNNFAYTHFNSEQNKNIAVEENILDLTAARDSTFYKKNILSTRTLDVLNSYNSNIDLNLFNFLNKNSIKYLILKNSQSLPECLKTKHIQTIQRKAAVRNFLVKKNASNQNVNVVKIILNNCK